jgi:8-oxo-dGTP diphosphatase
MFPGGQKHEQESAKDCLRREIKEELPKLKLRRIKLWKEVKRHEPSFR